MKWNTGKSVKTLQKYYDKTICENKDFSQWTVFVKKIHHGSVSES